MHEAQGHHAPQSALGPLGLPAVRRTADGERRATGQRPRVLFLSCHLPWPPLSGGRRRELELLRRVARRFDVDLLVVSKTPAQDLANRDRLRRPAPPAPAGGRTAGAAIRGQTPWQVLRHRSPAATARVREILAAGQTELIHVEGYYLMQHLPEPSPVPVLLVEQNVEYQLERQMELERQTQLGHPDQPRLTAERRRPRTDAAPPTPAQITEEVERACWRRATRLAAVTGEDARTMRLHGAPAPVAVVPDGADHIPRLHMVRGTLPRPPAPVSGDPARHPPPGGRAGAVAGGHLASPRGAGAGGRDGAGDRAGRRRGALSGCRRCDRLSAADRRGDQGQDAGGPAPGQGDRHLLGGSAGPAAGGPPGDRDRRRPAAVRAPHQRAAAGAAGAGGAGAAGGPCRPPAPDLGGGGAPPDGAL